MQEFFAICEYFELTPAEFFNTDVADPLVYSEITESLRKLSDSDMELVLKLIKRLTNAKE